MDVCAVLVIFFFFFCCGCFYYYFTQIAKNIVSLMLGAKM